VAECTGRIGRVYGDLVLGRVEDDLNLYIYVGNDPLDKTDPSGNDPGDPYPSPEAAANDALNFINPTSISENKEYAGYVYEKDGSYYASKPESGNGDSATHAVPKIAKGDYHTHGDYSKQGKDGKPERTGKKSSDGYESDHFSTPDKENSSKLKKATGDENYKSYLGTPSKTNKQYDPTKHRESDLVVPPPPPVPPVSPGNIPSI
jgi:Domain of unknown function (DUF4329)